MLSVDQAESLILKTAQSLTDQEITTLLNAQQRILATDISSTLDFPYWDNSAMDGYAVRYADVQACGPDTPAILDVVTEIPAGTCPNLSLAPGQAARIFTGAMVPQGADTVVMQENTLRQGDQVHILQCPQPQAFVRKRGAYYQAGVPILKQGMTLTPPDIAILATVQCTEIPVYRRPVVAILSTGNELVAPDQPLQAGQIVDSNRYALAALVQATGAEVQLIDLVGDTVEDLKAAIASTIPQADVVISSGGVSVGDYDYVDQVLAELNADIHIRSVAVKPGKPLTFATFPTADGSQPVLYFGLPGNPVSALVSFWRFVQPALRKVSGQSGSWRPRFVEARTLHPLPAGGRREIYLWGQLSLDDGQYEFTLAGGSHSSGNLMNLSQTNGLVVIPVDHPAVEAGESVSVMQVGEATT
ncbi:gephyrin-like molybdotransferase Glp [Acaryochloris sp. CCMEE 5410]|uniref:molybdopterin molybdotransferase MoeA n=1 Tax=Acaryochloris sp. CCMEE 5410 TaxID=310037 RepID=UPI0002483C36|nr:gephyrin-like molybdotransferase Glp [Acaryochloris sp. CCMEE 5410]KAI9131177.1 molybdopterin molybdotransferase MoeA [Acaryochloris sp. CCMEE 5410]